MKSIAYVQRMKSCKKHPKEDSDGHQYDHVDTAQCLMKWNLVQWRLSARHLGFLLSRQFQLLLDATDPLDHSSPPRPSWLRIAWQNKTIIPHNTSDCGFSENLPLQKACYTMYKSSSLCALVRSLMATCSIKLSNDIQYAYRSPCYGEIAVSYRPRAVVSLKIFVYAYSWMSQYRVSLERDSAAMSTIKILLVLFNVSIINMHKLMEAIIPIVWFVAVAMASVKLRQWIH